MQYTYEEITQKLREYAEIQEAMCRLMPNWDSMKEYVQLFRDAADAIQQLVEKENKPIQDGEKYYHFPDPKTVINDEILNEIAEEERNRQEKYKDFEKYCVLVQDNLNPGFCDDDCTVCRQKWLDKKKEKKDGIY